MKVALYVPPIPDENTTPPLGPLYLAAVLERDGFQVRVFDARIDRMAFQKTVAFGPDVLGVSAVTPGYLGGLRATTRLKESRPHVRTVFGGPHPSALPESVAAESVVDFVLVGEAEETFLDLCRRLRDGDRDVPRIGGASGHPTIHDLDALPLPAFHTMNLEAYFSGTQAHGLFRRGKRVLPILSTRGCPHSCTFCCRVMGQKIRNRSVEAVMAEIRFLVDRYGIDEVYFEDDNFTVQRGRAFGDSRPPRRLPAAHPRQVRERRPRRPCRPRDSPSDEAGTRLFPLLCPSCWARRATDIAAHLVARVLPEAPWRQWVLTFPWEVRFLLGVDPAFLSEMLAAFTRVLFAWMRCRARRAGVRGGQPGSVTFVQRFGGVLNLNPHFHSLMPDGVFAEDQDSRVQLVRLPPPTDADVRALAHRVSARLTPIARRRLEQAGEDPRWHDSDRAAVLASHQEALRLPGSRGDGHDDSGGKPLCSRVHGFSLHAARTVEPGDRAGLERLCRLGLRAPMSLDRLSIDQDGMVHCRLFRPWPTPEGRTDLVLEPVAFLRRLAALIPAPYSNLVRYRGVFANRSKLRTRLPPPPVGGF